MTDDLRAAIDRIKALECFCTTCLRQQDIQRKTWPPAGQRETEGRRTRVNICAVLTMMNVLGPLPHEPTMNESTERWGAAQKEDRLIVVDPRNTFVPLYVCKHCGSIYAVTED